MLLFGAYYGTGDSGLFYLGGSALIFDFAAGILKPESFSVPLLVIGLFTFGIGLLDLFAP
jgi:hypothetical protein